MLSTCTFQSLTLIHNGLEFHMYAHKILMLFQLNRLYAIDANSHHACAASETRLTRIRVSCTVLTFGRDSSTKEESTYPWRSTTLSTVVPVTTPIVKRVKHIALSASIVAVGKYSIIE